MFALNTKTAAFVRSLALTGLLLPTAAWGLSCEGRVIGTNINFGRVNIFSNEPPPVVTTVEFTCTADRNEPAYPAVSVCLAINGGNRPGSTEARRHMCRKGRPCHTDNQKLYYNLYSDPGHTRFVGTMPTNTLKTTLSIPPGSGQRRVSKEVYLYSKIDPGQHGIEHGTYEAAFENEATLLIFQSGHDCGEAKDDGKGVRVPFKVSADIVSGCRIDADNLDFGSVRAGTENITGRTQIRATCPSGLRYTIGLASQNRLASQNPPADGWGIMLPIAPSGQIMTSEAGIRYSLHRTEPTSDTNLWKAAPDWTHTRHGTGSAQRHTVYARVPSTGDYRPGRYQDTVTVNVFY